MTLNDTAAAWAPWVLSILRIVAALLLLQHGLRRRRLPALRHARPELLA